MNRTLLLVRHATSVIPTVGGPDDYARPLSERGLAQAEDLAETLVAYRPHRFLASPYLRAVQTVRPAADRLGLPVETRDALREWHSGVAPTPDWQPYYRHCWDHPGHAAPGGETHDALGARAVAAIERIRSETPVGAVVVVGSHGGWISRALHALGQPVDCDFWSRCRCRRSTSSPTTATVLPSLARVGNGRARSPTSGRRAASAALGDPSQVIRIPCR